MSTRFLRISTGFLSVCFAARAGHGYIVRPSSPGARTWLPEIIDETTAEVVAADTSAGCGDAAD